MDKIKLQTCYLPILSKDWAIPYFKEEGGQILNRIHDAVILSKEEFTNIALDLFQAGATHANDISSVNFLSEATTNNFTEYINRLFE